MKLRTYTLEPFFKDIFTIVDEYLFNKRDNILVLLFACNHLELFHVIYHLHVEEFIFTKLLLSFSEEEAQIQLIPIIHSFRANLPPGQSPGCSRIIPPI